MFNGVIIFAILIYIVIDVSVALIIQKAGMSFVLGLIPVVQFFLLGKVANKFMIGVIVACLTAITGIISLYTLSLGIKQLNAFNESNIPEQTIMVEREVTDGQGNVISHSVSYEPLDDSSSTEKLLDIMRSPELKMINSMDNFIELVEFVFYVILMYGVCSKFDKGIGFLIGILFLPFIFLPIMALDSSSYSYWN